MTIKTANNKTLTETILDWFERNPTSAMRSTQLAKALKISPDRIADGLWRLADHGKLVKCKVIVGDSERTRGSPKTQWEYKLPAGDYALAEVKPYAPPKAYRRGDPTTPAPAATLAGSGPKTPAASDPVSLVEGGTHDADFRPEADAVVTPEPPKPDEAPVEVGSDVSQAPEYHPDEVCFDAVKRADALRERAEAAELEAGNMRFVLAAIEKALNPQPDEGFVPAIKRLQDKAENLERDIGSLWGSVVKFCGYVAELAPGSDHPLNLHQCQNIISGLLLLDDALEERTRLEELALNASEWREVAEQYGYETPLDMAGYIGELLNRIASLEANSSLPLEIAPEAASTAVVKESLTAQPADMVNHPPHYQGKVECIDAIESALGPDGFAAYCRGNAIKYTFRAGRKGDAAQDIAKAGWYLRRINHTEHSA